MRINSVRETGMGMFYLRTVDIAGIRVTLVAILSKPNPYSAAPLGESICSNVDFCHICIIINDTNMTEGGEL